MARSNNVTKSMWQIVRDTTNKNRTRAKPKLTMKIHSKLTSNPKEIANALNDYFASVGKTVSPSAGAGASQPKPLGRSVHAPRENSMYLRLVEPREMYDIIRSLKNKNSCGIDEVPPSLLRKCAKELTLPFYLLVNQSFTDGVFPDLLKKSIIKPIHKKGEKTDPQNYRPIALLPAASKIFETAMCRQLNSFCEKFSIFDDSQHGFRMNRSTTLAVFKYIHEVCNMLNDKKRPVGVMLDMSKAYDRVQYDILLKKIYGIGIRGPPYIWFKSYLENREQYVDIEHYDKKN